MSDFSNPGRKYRSFRPRQAARGMKALSTVTNFATFFLNNNTTGAQLLVVRDLTINGQAAGNVAASYVLGPLGTGPGKVQQMVPSNPVQVGVLTSADQTTNYPGDYLAALSSTGVWEWEHDFPFAVLEPNWTLVLMSLSLGQAASVAAVWETVYEDQLDYAW